MAHINEDSNMEPLVFRVPLALKDEFFRKYNQRGQRSKIVRGLLQMFLKGEIKTVKYANTTIETFGPNKN